MSSCVTGGHAKLTHKHTHTQAQLVYSVCLDPFEDMLTLSATVFHRSEMAVRNLLLEVVLRIAVHDVLADDLGSSRTPVPAADNHRPTTWSMGVHASGLRRRLRIRICTPTRSAI